jgi:hypothetical protein
MPVTAFSYHAHRAEEKHIDRDGGDLERVVLSPKGTADTGEQGEDGSYGSSLGRGGPSLRSQTSVSRQKTAGGQSSLRSFGLPKIFGSRKDVFVPVGVFGSQPVDSDAGMITDYDSKEADLTSDKESGTKDSPRKDSSNGKDLGKGAIGATPVGKRDMLSAGIELARLDSTKMILSSALDNDDIYDDEKDGSHSGSSPIPLPAMDTQREIEMLSLRPISPDERRTHSRADTIAMITGDILMSGKTAGHDVDAQMQSAHYFEERGQSIKNPKVKKALHIALDNAIEALFAGVGDDDSDVAGDDREAAGHMFMASGERFDGEFMVSMDEWHALDLDAFDDPEVSHSLHESDDSDADNWNAMKQTIRAKQSRAAEESGDGLKVREPKARKGTIDLGTLYGEGADTDGDGYGTDRDGIVRRSAATDAATHMDTESSEFEVNVFELSDTMQRQLELFEEADDSMSTDSDYEKVGVDVDAYGRQLVVDADTGERRVSGLGLVETAVRRKSVQAQKRMSARISGQAAGGMLPGLSATQQKSLQRGFADTMKATSVSFSDTISEGDEDAGGKGPRAMKPQASMLIVVDTHDSGADGDSESDYGSDSEDPLYAGATPIRVGGDDDEEQEKGDGIGALPAKADGVSELLSKHSRESLMDKAGGPSSPRRFQTDFALAAALASDDLDESDSSHGGEVTDAEDDVKAEKLVIDTEAAAKASKAFDGDKSPSSVAFHQLEVTQKHSDHHSKMISASVVLMSPQSDDESDDTPMMLLAGIDEATAMSSGAPDEDAKEDGGVTPAASPSSDDAKAGAAGTVEDGPLHHEATLGDLWETAKKSVDQGILDDDDDDDDKDDDGDDLIGAGSEDDEQPFIGRMTTIEKKMELEKAYSLAIEDEEEDQD